MRIKSEEMKGYYYYGSSQKCSLKVFFVPHLFMELFIGKYMIWIEHQ